MRGRKATTYIINTVIFTGLFVLMVFIAKDAIAIVGSTIILAMLLNTGLFIGGNSLDKMTNLKDKMTNLMEGKHDNY